MVIEVLLRHLPRIVVICLAVLVLVAPRRWWGRVTWMPWALSSALCTALLLHDLLLILSAALLARGPVLQGRVLLLALFSIVTASLTVAASVSAVRQWRRGRV